MIPGLEYEQPDHYGGYASSPSSSVQSVDISPHNDHYGLHRRHVAKPNNHNGTRNGSGGDYDKYKPKRALKKLDLFPKMERDYQVRTDRGGNLTLMGYGLLFILVVAEFLEWRGMNKGSLEHIVVDTR